MSASRSLPLKLKTLQGYLAHKKTSYFRRRCDGVLLAALKAGHWVLLDELNLAPQVDFLHNCNHKTSGQDDVERVWHISNSQDQILALAFRQKSLTPLHWVLLDGLNLAPQVTSHIKSYNLRILVYLVIYDSG